MPALESLALPIEWTTFIGRERDLSTLAELLGSARLLTLTGPGGVGKTRLALRLAAMAAAEDAGSIRPDGVYLVELSGLENPSLLPVTVAAALGIRESSGQPLTELVAASLGNKAPLIVLDNCEHLILACAELLSTWLGVAPRLRVLATSRVPIGLPGERLWRVEPLGLPETTASPEQLAESEAVRLFVDRATLVRRTFAPTDDDLRSIARICTLLDGLPLAIELAAARVKVLTVAQIAAKLEPPRSGEPAVATSDQRLQLLTGGSRALPERQQTLRGLIDWSYDLLSEPERVMLRRLAVFTSGATLDAAEAVCASDLIRTADVLDLLSALVDNSLAYADEITGGEMRFRLLESIRVYADEKLRAAGEDQLLRRRHLDWALSVAEESALQLRGPAQREWLTKLAALHDEFRAALAWAAQTGNVEDEVRLAGALWRFWSRHGFLEQGQRALEAALARATERSIPAHVLARALVGAGMLAGRRGESSHATELFERALAVARGADETYFQASALAGLGHMAFDVGDLAAARGYYTAALEMYRARGDSLDIPAALHNLGNVAHHERDLDTARRLYEDSLAASRGNGDEQGQATELLHLAGILIKLRSPEQAIQLCAESLRHLRAVGDRIAIPEGLDQAARCCLLQRRPSQAATLLAAASRLRDEIGAPVRARDRDERERDIERARAGLTPSEFADAWAAGERLSTDAAIDLVLSAGVAARDEPPPVETTTRVVDSRVAALTTVAASREAVLTPAAEPHERAFGPDTESRGPALTRREREIAVLVAGGLTNREIAQSLVIAEGTTERHLANIFTKLGVTSRARLAAWAVEHGLVTA